MSTQNEAAAAYLSELLRQKDQEVRLFEIQEKELVAALEKIRAQLKKSSEERALLAFSKGEVEKPAKPAADNVVQIHVESVPPQEEPAPVEEPPAEPPEEEPSPPAAEATPPKRGRKKAAAKKKAPKKGKKPEAARQITKGARPPLKRTMHEILGSGRVMSAPEMMEALKEKGCMPRSKQPQVLISWTFSNNKDAFIRVSHGKYRGNPDFKPRNSQPPPPPLSQDEVDSELADMGLGDLGSGAIENPFQSC